ncbi:MAG: hypothetical protein IMW89_19860 [Ktedonobacteraceae bacterium]|nr:hypothetical protein [Ktedonobacteraceae bacterium]
MNIFSQGGQNPRQGGGMTGDAIAPVRQQVEQQISQAIDRLAGMVPGGEQFTAQAKQTISGVLDQLQSRLEDEIVKRAGSINVGGFNAGEMLGGGGEQPAQGS